MSGSAPIIVITEKQQSVLSEFAASRTISVSLAQRSKIILMAFERIHNDEIVEAVVFWPSVSSVNGVRV